MFIFLYVVSLGWMDGFSKESMNVSLDEKKKDTQEIYWF